MYTYICPCCLGTYTHVHVCVCDIMEFVTSIVCNKIIKSSTLTYICRAYLVYPFCAAWLLSCTYVRVQVDPEMRIRFTSPHPKDFPDEVTCTYTHVIAVVVFVVWSFYAWGYIACTVYSISITYVQIHFLSSLRRFSEWRRVHMLGRNFPY